VLDQKDKEVFVFAAACVIAFNLFPYSVAQLFIVISH